MEVLFAALIGVGVISFWINRRDIMAPTNMVCAVFLIGTLFAWFEKGYWQYDYSQKTTIVIIGSILCMIAGALLANTLESFLEKHYQKKMSDQESADQERNSEEGAHWYDVKTPSLSCIIVITMVSVITAWFFYKDIFDHAVKTNPQLTMKDITLIGTEIKRLSLNGEFQFRKYNAWLQYFRKGIAYCCIYLYLRAGTENRLNLMKRCYFLMPVVPFLFCCYITGIRTEFIFIVVYTITVFGITLLVDGHTSLQLYVKVFAVGMAAVAVMMAIWSGTYLVRRNITSLQQIDNQTCHQMIDNFAVYTGGGIVELDEFLKNPQGTNEVFGQHTLQNVYSKLNRLGGGFPDIKLHIYEYACAGNLNTNVFTAFRRYIEDFGMIGNCLICLGLGMIYTGYYRLAKRKKRTPLYLMTYAALVFPLFVMTSEDYFFMYIVDTTPLYICGFIILSWMVLSRTGYLLSRRKK